MRPVRRYAGKVRGILMSRDPSGIGLVAKAPASPGSRSTLGLARGARPLLTQEEMNSDT